MFSNVPQEILVLRQVRTEGRMGESRGRGCLDRRETLKGTQVKDGEAVKIKANLTKL